MNFLAHLWLADRAGAELAGAVLGDVLRGRLPDALPAALAHSVRLHRRLDAETDRHPRVRAARTRFGPGARRHAGILLDLLYDHALARDWDAFSDEPLERFAGRAAAEVAKADAWFGAQGAPPAHRFTALLVSYGSDAGFRLAVERTARRLRRPQGLLEALAEAPRHRDAARIDLAVLLPDLASRAREFGRSG